MFTSSLPFSLVLLILSTSSFAQQQFNNVTLDPAASTLFSTSSGTLSPVGTTEDGGRILAACTLDSTVYVAGSFSQIGGTSAQNVAAFDSSSSSFSALPKGGPNDAVHALYCDSANNLLWLGGNFTLPSPGAAAYAPHNSSWVPAPFVGLSGEVLAITPFADAQSIYFAGSFITAFSSNSTNSTFGNNPNVPYSAGATPYSSSLVPIPLQGAQITAEPATGQTGFSDITNILCPAGADGEGNTWLAQDGSAAQITVRTFRNEGVSGVRLGNTFVQGRGTTAFTVTTIPNNQVLPLSYIDPVTNTTQNCSDSCPLLTNTTIPYQDFIFNQTPALTITGFQLTLNTWAGAGAGLHLLQLLSEGSFASFVPGLDTASCFAPGPTTVTQTGNWQEVNVTTNTAGTVQPILQATLPTNTPPASSPSLDLSVYVSAVGYYTVYFVTPGCTLMEDCDLRTTVQVTISPGNSVAPVTQEIDQRVTSDTITTVYRGPVYPTSPSFTIPVSLRLSGTPAGTGSDGNYDMVADQVQFVLTAAPNGTGESVVGEGVPGYNLTMTSSGIARGFGLFEWPERSAAENATGTLSTGLETSVDQAGAALYAGILGASMNSFSVAAIAQFGASVISALAVGNNGTLYIGGLFTLSTVGASNIVMWNGSDLIPLPSGGLNGPVTALAIDNSAGHLYVGGSFSGPQGSTESGFTGIGLFDIAASKWTSMAGGLNGPVTGLAFSSNQLLVVGNFTALPQNSGIPAAGIASWSLSAASWNPPSGFVVGNLSFISTDGQFMGGRVSMSSISYGSSGHLSEGLVILVCIVIGAGCVLMLFLIGLLIALWLRRSEQAPQALADKDDDDAASSIGQHPSTLLEHVQAATRATIIGEGAFAGGNIRSEGSHEQVADDSMETEEAVGGAGPFADDGRVAHARYSFEASGEGELEIHAGTQVQVLDDRDTSWWLVRDVETGREGIIPASYLL
ncbi:hypothetical protein DACRYDRAFT_93708 [Dacryopinax primogenitus]|uniref:SH3 domain-containing protein n=1 Tax=Dacryopinax primogenitus (strain DJM 731) TaxID=1858805 RepID=M5GFR9_DACPD|nr:uncharacterized protein DACRYDRAFT_93708 [Dacryopinax primogenitus]EJU04368.1 hypothetical protein DACRYDRAFT_93708 [Dacryopinax primogenitus]